ncbi:hypothetical protein BH11PLA2_BH11PLA2_13540 [soil metagenome]
MLRLFVTNLEDRSVPSTTTAPTDTTTTPTTTTTTVTAPDPTTTDTTTTDTTTTGTDTGTKVDDPTATPDETVQTLGGDTPVETTAAPSLPPVVFGEGNFTPLGVGAKYALVSGLRNGEARLFGFDSDGNLVDTGKSYTPFGSAYKDLVAVRGTVGDFNGDGVADMAFTTANGGVTQVRVINGKTGADLVSTRTVFGDYYQNGAYVTAADINNDGKDELIVTPDAGGGPRIRIFAINANGDLVSKADFFGIDDTTNRGGVQAAVGDMNGDGKKDLVITASSASGPRVAVYDGSQLTSTGTPPKWINEFNALPGDDAKTLRGNVSVAVGDLNNDGFADVVFGSSGSSQVYALDGKQVLTDASKAGETPIANFSSSTYAAQKSVRVAIKDFDGDGKADLITGSGEGVASKVTGYRRQQLTASPTNPNASIVAEMFKNIKNANVLSTGVTVG